MSDTKKIARPRCAWCGRKIVGKLRQALRWGPLWYCGEACGPKQGRRGRTRPSSIEGDEKGVGRAD